MGFFSNIIRDSRIATNKMAVNNTPKKNTMARSFYEQNHYHMDDIGEAATKTNASNVVSKINNNQSAPNIKARPGQTLTTERKTSLSPFEQSASDYHLEADSSEPVEQKTSSPVQQKIINSETKQFSINQVGANEHNRVETQSAQSERKQISQKHVSKSENESELVYKHAMTNDPADVNHKVDMQLTDNQETGRNFLNQPITAEAEIKHQEQTRNQNGIDDSKVIIKSQEQFNNTEKTVVQRSAQETVNLNQLNSQPTYVTVNNPNTNVKKQQTKIPQVRIGQINVVIESSQKQAVVHHTNASTSNISSRLFLRGL